MNDLEMIGRLLMSALLGTLVGIERQWRHKNAGLKTNALVSIGATAFGLIALGSFGPGGNPTQIAASVVTGIGFIGAGVIMHRGASVQGINTAATLWAAAGMGLAIGQGAYHLAVFVFGTVIIVQFCLRWATDYINRRSGVTYGSTGFELAIRFKKSGVEDVRRLWDDFRAEPGIRVTRYVEERDDQVETVEASFDVAPDRVHEAALLSQKFSQVPGVIQLRLEQTPPENV
ncbi:MAG TPA: MgtC/SapB family protein [Blastocatellia bacterium]|nr:MgtC/SapB family protein [Blastocatellia bacterium]